MIQRTRYIQVVSEALLPVLGYLLWDWSLYFILLYYLLDMLADVVITHLKSNKIIESTNASKKLWFSLGTVGLLLFMATVLLINVAVSAIEPEMDFKNEIIAFWVYEDMGIEQGYILIPLIGFVSYQQYKMEFLRFKYFERITLNQLWRSKFLAFGAMILFCCIVLLIAQFGIFHESIYVGGIILLSSIYQLIKGRLI